MINVLHKVGKRPGTEHIPDKEHQTQVQQGPAFGGGKCFGKSKAGPLPPSLTENGDQHGADAIDQQQVVNKVKEIDLYHVIDGYG